MAGIEAVSFVHVAAASLEAQRSMARAARWVPVESATTEPHNCPDAGVPAVRSIHPPALPLLEEPTDEPLTPEVEAADELVLPTELLDDADTPAPDVLAIPEFNAPELDVEASVDADAPWPAPPLEFEPGTPVDAIELPGSPAPLDKEPGRCADGGR